MGVVILALATSAMAWMILTMPDFVCARICSPEKTQTRVYLRIRVSHVTLAVESVLILYRMTRRFGIVLSAH